jgi:hypothetical protein
MNHSLYIPTIATSVSEAYVKTMFAKHNIGKVSRVDFVQNVIKGRREAFVHFEEWFTTPEATKLQADILNPAIQAQFKYCESGKFWWVMVNTNSNQRVYNPDYKNLTRKEVKTGYTASLMHYCSNYVSASTVGNKKQNILGTQPKCVVSI